MQRKPHMDLFGASLLITFAAIMGFNQVVISVGNEGWQPIFFAGIRSFLGIFCLWIWFRIQNRPLGIELKDLKWGTVIGLFFGVEFIFLFLALDYTTVTRTSIIYYSMPLWLALLAHWLLPEEPMTKVKGTGHLLAFLGVALAIGARGGGGEASLLGDLLALAAAFCWAGLTLVARTGLSHVAPDRQLMWQLIVSALILLPLAPLFGPLIRDLAPIHFWALGFQTTVVVTAAFAMWFWLLKIYPAASVAAFSFLSPIFGVGFGWLLLSEQLGVSDIAALVLVVVGLFLINRPARPASSLH